jgi:hypothetical protein
MGLTKGDDFNGPMGEQKEVSDCGQEGGGGRERDVEMEERERGKGRIWDYDERRTEDIR